MLPFSESFQHFHIAISPCQIQPHLIILVLLSPLRVFDHCLLLLSISLISTLSGAYKNKYMLISSFVCLINA